MKINFLPKQKTFTKTKMSHMSSLFRNSYIFICLAIIYLPLIMVVIVSFFGQDAKGKINLMAWKFTMKNYLLLFKEDEFVNGLINSILIAMVVVPISTTLGLITCFGIWNKKNKATEMVNSLAKGSLGVPDSVTGLSLLLLFASTWISLGFNLGFFTIVLSHISFCTPYAIITIYPKICKMKKEYILASYDLGYRRFKTFFNIVIDFVWPALLSAIVITFAMSFDDFIITSLVNGSTSTVATIIYNMRKGIKAWVVTFGAIVILITLLIFLISAIMQLKQKKSNKSVLIN